MIEVTDLADTCESDKTWFSPPGSILRRIWGDSDTVLFIFAGAAAEFAFNEAVDWLFYTGKLPSDPVGRLLSTITYAHRIIFASKEEAYAAIAQINAIHKSVEQQRQSHIPPAAYLDVLNMLIAYSIGAYELLYRKLKPAEKTEVYNAFKDMGTGMNLPSLPATYSDWLAERTYLQHRLKPSAYSNLLFAQYRKALGKFRYKLLLMVQEQLLPETLKKTLNLKQSVFFLPLIGIYKLIRNSYFGNRLKALLLPVQYRSGILAINR